MTATYLGTAPTFFAAYRAWQQTPPPSWDDVRWLGIAGCVLAGEQQLVAEARRLARKKRVNAQPASSLG